jgi:hypothetical protein
MPGSFSRESQYYVWIPYGSPRLSSTLSCGSATPTHTRATKSPAFMYESCSDGGENWWGSIPMTLKNPTKHASQITRAVEGQRRRHAEA